MLEFMSEKHERLRQARIDAGYKSAAAAAEALGVTASTYRAHENGQNDFGYKEASWYARRFNSNALWLVEGIEPNPELTKAAQWLTEKSNKEFAERLSSMGRPQPNASFPPRYQKFPGDVAIPVRGHISAGPNGRFILNGQDIAHVFCPPGLEDVEGAYAVIIQGSSGEPRFYNGETAWINPHARVRERDDVIVQVLEDDGEIASYIKRYVSRSEDVLRLYQYNPGEGESHDLEFDNQKVFSVHKVVFHALL